MVDYKEIALKIKNNRKRLNLTQKEFGEKIGKTESSIRKYEKGLTQIPNDVLQKMADIFNIGIFELMGIEKKELSLNSEDIYKEIEKIVNTTNLDLKKNEEEEYNELMPLVKEFLGENSDEILKKIIRDKIITTELAKNLELYFKNQNSNYTTEELSNLIKQALVLLEVLSKK